ncbi:MAG: hypothetical protein ABL963_01180 [Longimicrobiales bacterium]
MRQEAHRLYEAIDRWERSGLIDADTASRLRVDVSHEASAGTLRLSRYLLAVTGGVVLLIAGGVFLDWAWPLIGDGARALVLAAAGAVVVTVGVALEERTERWRPAAYLMQTAGLGLLFSAFVYSRRAWADLSLGGVLVGVLSLVVPIVLAPRAMRRNRVMPAVHLAFGLAFLAVFLERATPLSEDAIIWVLDAVLLATLLMLSRALSSEGGVERHPWMVNALVTAMGSGFLLVTWTGLGPLDLSEDAIWPLDLWLALTVGLGVWGIERGPPSLSREWLGDLLAWLLVAWIALGFYTSLEALDGPPELPLLLVGGAGVAAFVYANGRGLRSLMGAATLAFVAPLWYWAVDRGGALGAVAALVATAGILFWVSGRIGKRPAAG